MMVRAKCGNRGRGVAVVFGAVAALTLVLMGVMGCAPQQAGDKSSSVNKQEQVQEGMNGQPVNWTMQSDCVACHTNEASSMSDSACVQALAHKNEACIDCHTEESVLQTAHEGVTYGDKPASKATVKTVAEKTCITCHGTLAEMAVVTAGSTALTDSNGVSVNPHERPAGQKHEENPATCTDCHNNHSKTLEKDAMKYCAQCHHRGVFACGTCHEIRDR